MPERAYAIWGLGIARGGSEDVPVRDDFVDDSDGSSDPDPEDQAEDEYAFVIRVRPTGDEDNFIDDDDWYLRVGERGSQDSQTLPGASGSEPCERPRLLPGGRVLYSSQGVQRRSQTQGKGNCAGRLGVSGGKQSVGESFLEEETNYNEHSSPCFVNGFVAAGGPFCFRRHNHRRFSILFGPVSAAPFYFAYALAVLIVRVACCWSSVGRNAKAEAEAVAWLDCRAIDVAAEADIDVAAFQWAIDVVRLAVVLGIGLIVVASLSSPLISLVPVMIFAVAHATLVTAWLYEPAVMLASECTEAAQADLLISCYRWAPFAVLVSNFVGVFRLILFLQVPLSFTQNISIMYTALLLPWLSSLLISYVANEIRIFLVQELHIPESDRKGKRYGVEGIRAMHPILCTATASTTFFICFSIAIAITPKVILKDDKPTVFALSALAVLCSLWPLVWSARVVFSVADILNYTTTESKVWKTCDIFWLISWQGLAAVNLASMVLSLALGLYSFTLLKQIPQQVDCVASYTCPQEYDPCPVPTDAFGVSHNTSFNCVNLGCVSKPRVVDTFFNLNSNSLQPTFGSFDGCVRKDSCDPSKDCCGRGTMFYGACVCISGFSGTSCGITVSGSSSCLSKSPELHCDIFKGVALGDIFFAGIAPSSYSFPNGSECKPSVEQSNVTNAKGDYTYSIQPPNCTCAYYTPDCCDQTPIKWSTNEGNWSDANGTAPFTAVNSLRSTLKTVLIAWIATAAFGVIVCSLTVLGRYWPQCKCFPTDDAFRLTVVMKLALLILKAGVQSMAGHGMNADNPEGRLLSWLSYIAFILSLSLAALVTIAYQLFKAWRIVDVLGRIHRPRLFMVCYVLNYVSAKAIAIHVLLIALSIDNRCSEESQNLVSFMLSVYGPSLLLLMYNNNECAKFIDGSVHRHKKVSTHPSMLSSMMKASFLQQSPNSPTEIGLSTSPEGVKAIGALSLIGQLIGFGFAIMHSVQPSHQYHAGNSLPLFNQSTIITAIVITSVTSLSGFVMRAAN